MTVSQAVPVIDYVGNGVSTVFAFAFRIFAAADLLVTVDGVTVTNYTTTITPQPGFGGSITFNVAPATGTLIRLRRNLPFQRSVDYQQGGSLPEQTLDDDQDAPVMMVQQLEADIDELLTSALRVPEIESIAALPGPLTRALRVLGFDAAGLPALYELLSAGTPAAGFANPMTTPGDLIVGGAAGLPTRLPIGADGRILTVAGGAVSWQVAPAGGDSIQWQSNGVNAGAAGDVDTVDFTGGLQAAYATGKLTVSLAPSTLSDETYTQDFTSAQTWNVTGVATPVYTSGRVQVTTSNGNDAQIRIDPVTEFADGEISADVTLAAGGAFGTGWAVALAFRVFQFIGDGRVYGYHVQFINTGALQIVRGALTTGGAQTVLVTTNAGLYLANTTYRLRVTFVGTAIRVYVNDQLRLSVVDASFTTGRTALRFFCGETTTYTGAFDNLTVIKYAQVAAATAASGALAIPSVVAEPVAPPPFDNWSFVNQGTTVLYSGDGPNILLAIPFSSVGTSNRLYVRTPATANYQIEAKLRAIIKTSNFAGAALYLYDSVGTRNVSLQVDNVGGLAVNKFTNPTTFSSSYALSYNPFLNQATYPTPTHGTITRDLWLRIRVEAANLRFYWSMDGWHWIELLSTTRTDWLPTIDRIGFGGYCDSTDLPVGARTFVLLESWKETAI